LRPKPESGFEASRPRRLLKAFTGLACTPILAPVCAVVQLNYGNVDEDCSISKSSGLLTRTGLSSTSNYRIVIYRTLKRAMMKLFFSFVGISICGFAYAQHSPALPSGPSEEMLPGVSTLRPEFAPVPSTVPPGNPTAAVSPRSPQDLMDLIRAQTEAIRVLSSKVDSFDDRLRKIENRLR